MYIEFARQHIIYEDPAILIHAGLSRRYSQSIDRFLDNLPMHDTHSTLPTWVLEIRPHRAWSSELFWRPQNFHAGYIFDCELHLNTRCLHVLSAKGGTFGAIELSLLPGAVREPKKEGFVDWEETAGYCTVFSMICQFFYNQQT